MGITGLMEIGRSGLGVYQSAIEITSENIANVNTPGYSRQRVLFRTAPIQYPGVPVGTGVEIAAIQRYYDTLLQRQQITGETTEGFDTTKSKVLQQIEPTFNEVATDGLGAAITDYFNAWQDLTLNPAGTPERQTVLTRGQLLADNFRSVSQTLNDSIDVQDASLVPLTNSINATLKDIAQLNLQIKTINVSGGNSNETMDRRDQLIRDLSSKIGITYTENSDGTTDLSFADSGAAIVTGSLAGSFSLTPNGAVPPRYDINLTDAAGGGPAVVAPTSGELGATVALRDTIIPGYLAQVDQLAKSIVDNVNALHAAGFSPTGGTGQNFFTPIAAVAGAAGNISLDAALTTTNLAASQAAATPGDNSNALAIAQLANFNDPALNATFNGYFDALSSTVGLDVLSSKNTVAQDEAFNRQLAALRESNSGVSLDEELTNLVKYQRSYQASAKLITTATEMLDMVLGLVR